MDYKKEIIEMVKSINNVVILAKIHTIVKTYIEILKGEE